LNGPAGSRYPPVTASSEPIQPREVRLKDLRTGDTPVEFVARVVTCERREVARKSDGSRRPLLSGLLSDGTATVRFTWWDPPREGVERGTVLRAVGPEIGEYRGRVEVTFGWKSRVGPASEAELPRVNPSELPAKSVRDLQPGDEGFRVVVRAIRVGERSVSVGEERRVLYEGLLADRSGTIGFSAWSDFRLRPGEALEITGAYVRSFRGASQLVLDERASIRRVEGADLPCPDDILLAPPRTMAQVEMEAAGASASVEGRVVGLLPPSGLVYRCPQCRRSLQGGVCRVHGAVTGEADLRARIVLDDGTGSVTVNAGRADTERLWGVTLETCRNRLRDQPDATVLEGELLDALLGRRLRVRGGSTKDDFGVTITPDSIEPAELDLETTAAQLSVRLGGRP
jgi:ssDNA-binding replication factor A large subunit